MFCQYAFVPMSLGFHVMFSLSLSLPPSSQPHFSTIFPAPMLMTIPLAPVPRTVVQTTTALVANSAAPMGVGATHVSRPSVHPTTPRPTAAGALRSMTTSRELVRNVVPTIRTVAVVRCAVLMGVVTSVCHHCRPVKPFCSQRPTGL